MRRILFLVAALCPWPAWAQSLSSNEFAAFAPEKIGQTVTINSCYAANASSAGVDCVTFAPAQHSNDLNWSVIIPIDGNSIDRPSLLRALNNCADLNRRTECQVSVTGTVYDAMADMGIQGDHSYALKNATLKWLSPTPN